MLTYPQIDPVALAVGPLKIHWYGLMYLIGFVGTWVIGKKKQRYQIRPYRHWLLKIWFIMVRWELCWAVGLVMCCSISLINF